MKTSFTNTVIPKGWASTTLENVCEVVAGNPAPQGKEFFENGTFNFVRVQDMGRLGDKTYISETNDRVNKRAISKLRLFPKGSVLFTKSGASTLNNQRAILGQDSYVVSHIAIAISNEGISNKWIYFFLKRIDFGDLAHSSVMPSLPLSKIKPLQILIPPTKEQHRIVAKIEELFSELDKGIENLKTARAQLKVYRQALLKHAFEGKLTAQWRAENKEKLETAADVQKRIQQERVQRYQQQLAAWEAAAKQGSKPKAPKVLPPLAAEELAELPELPNGWTYTSVGAVIDDPTYGTAKKCDYETDGVGVFRIPNVVSGKIDSSDLKFAQFTDDEVAAYKLNAGDILIIRSNGSISIVGRCALVSDADLDYLYAGYLIRLRPHQRLVKPEYLLNTFSLHTVRKQIEQKAKSTSGVNNINTGEIQSLAIALCCVEEQKQIILQLEFKLSVADQLDQTIATALQQAETLRQSILKKAFSGRLVPQDPQDEPASALLARIKAERGGIAKNVKVAASNQTTKRRFK